MEGQVCRGERLFSTPLRGRQLLDALCMGTEKANLEPRCCVNAMNQEWIHRFLQYLRIEKGLSDNTLASYKHDLAMYSEHLGTLSLLKVQQSDVSSFLKFLYNRKLKPRSAARTFPGRQSQMMVTMACRNRLKMSRMLRNLDPRQ